VPPVIKDDMEELDFSPLQQVIDDQSKQLQELQDELDDLTNTHDDLLILHDMVKDLLQEEKDKSEDLYQKIDAINTIAMKVL
jgi:predicted component of type VI protein secretion system